MNYDKQDFALTIAFIASIAVVMAAAYILFSGGV